MAVQRNHCSEALGTRVRRRLPFLRRPVISQYHALRLSRSWCSIAVCRTELLTGHRAQLDGEAGVVHGVWINRSERPIFNRNEICRGASSRLFAAALDVARLENWMELSNKQQQNEMPKGSIAPRSPLAAVMGWQLFSSSGVFFCKRQRKAHRES